MIAAVIAASFIVVALSEASWLEARMEEQKKKARYGRQDRSRAWRRQEKGRLGTEDGDKVNNRKFPFDLHEPNFNDLREVRKTGLR